MGIGVERQLSLGILKKGVKKVIVCRHQKDLRSESQQKEVPVDGVVRYI